MAVFFVYLFLLLYMWAGSLGMPAPEDIALITGGAACHPNAWAVLHPDVPPPNLYFMILLGYFGIMTGDCFIFFLGHTLGPKVTEYRLTRRLITPGRFEVIESHYWNHGFKTVFVGRYMPGVSFMVFLAAGVTRYRFWKFLLADSLAALISAPLWVIVGYKFAENLDPIKRTVAEAKWWIGIGAAVLIATFIAWKYWQHRKKKALAGPTTDSANPPALISKLPVVSQEG